MKNLNTVPITNKPGLQRDLNSKAIINSNKSELRAAQERSEYANRMRSRLESTERELALLKQEFAQMKSDLDKKFNFIGKHVTNNS